MVDRFLNPLEKFDLDRLTGRYTKKWLAVWYWILITAVAFRLFINFRVTHVFELAWLACLIGVWGSFLMIPWVVYQLVSKRVEDGTFHIEQTLPHKKTSLFMGKLKVAVIYILYWTGPLLLLAFILDPGLVLARYLTSLGWLYYIDNIFISFAIVIMTFLFYILFWLLLLIHLLFFALSKPPILVLAGRLLFLIFVSVFVLAWLDPIFDLGPGTNNYTNFEPLVYTRGYFTYNIATLGALLGLTITAFILTARRFQLK